MALATPDSDFRIDSTSNTVQSAVCYYDVVRERVWRIWCCNHRYLGSVEYCDTCHVNHLLDANETWSFAGVEVLGTVRSVDLVVECDGDLYKVVFHLRLRPDLTPTCVVFEVLISISGRSVKFPTGSP